MLRKAYTDFHSAESNDLERLKSRRNEESCRTEIVMQVTWQASIFWVTEERAFGSLDFDIVLDSTDELGKFLVGLLAQQSKLRTAL